MFGWGSIVTDSWLPPETASAKHRKELLRALAHAPERYLDCAAYAKPVVIEDNVWVGFGAVILPGVTIGRGAIIGCKTIIAEHVPPYAVVGGNPARVVRFLNPTDTEEARTAALDKLLQI
jgi:acetyltransferase-like isoleucine patch superfamily enzyme